MKKLKTLIGLLFVFCMLFSSFGVNTGAATAATQATDPITSGRYFIRNAFSGKYVYHATTSEHQTIRQSEFSDVNNMKWEINSAGNGYYTIESYVSGLYMTEGNDPSVSTDDTSCVVGNEYDGSDEQLWKFTKVGENLYTLTLKSGGDLSLDASSSNYTADNIGLTTAGNYGTWYFHSADTRYTISASIDKAYAERYGSTSARSRANKALDTLTKFYLEEFGVYIGSNFISSTGSSYADECGGTYSTKCTHTTDSGCRDSYRYTNSTDPVLNNYHHTNITNVLYHMPVPTNAKKYNFVFCGKKLCVAADHSEDSYYFGITDPGLRIIVVDNFINVAQEQKTVIHEVGHLYGAPDHAGHESEYNQAYGWSLFNKACIYGKDKDEPYVYNAKTMCEGCKRIISANINN